MPLVRRIRKRGANIVVEAHGEVLFAASGDVGRWTNRFSQRVRSFASQEAPSNKRPRWSHYGKPLKTTFTASTTYQPGRMRVYAAIGSSAAHAYYVDQGTGIYGGGGPYRAKVLPPWTRGSPSLYEHTWRPGGVGSARVKPVWIKGQKGQGFFDKGLSRGFRSMRMRAFQVPGEGGPKITEALNSMPTGMENFAGNTPVSGSFLANLERWRTWRDAAWVQHRELGRDGGRPRSRGTTPPGSKAASTAPADPAAALRAANLAAYHASIAASKRRAAAQAQKAKDMAAAKRARAERERKAQEATALRIGNAKMKRAATTFYNRIRMAYPNATLGSTTLPDGTRVYRVTYTTAGGEVVRQQWAYGYTT